MRVLIDGLSLSGRSTLTQELAHAFEAAGSPVEIGSGPMLPAFFDSVIQWLEDQARPSDSLISWVYCTLFFLEAVGFQRGVGEQGVYLHEGHIEHRIALAEAMGHTLAAKAMGLIVPFLGSFDMRIHLTVSHLERVRRYLRRKNNSPSHRLVLSNPDKLLKADRRLAELINGGHDLHLIGEEVGLEELSRDAINAIRLCSEERGLVLIPTEAYAA